MYECFAGSHGHELFAGNLCSDRSRRVIIGGKLDDNGCILREVSSQSWVFINLEFVVKVPENGPVRLVYEDEMTAQIIVFVSVGRTDWGSSRVDLPVEVVWDVLSIPFLGKLSDILGEDVVEGLEIPGSNGVPREWDRNRKF